MLCRGFSYTTCEVPFGGEEWRQTQDLLNECANDSEINNAVVSAAHTFTQLRKDKAAVIMCIAKHITDSEPRVCGVFWGLYKNDRGTGLLITQRAVVAQLHRGKGIYPRLWKHLLDVVKKKPTEKKKLRIRTSDAYEYAGTKEMMTRSSWLRWFKEAADEIGGGAEVNDSEDFPSLEIKTPELVSDEKHSRNNIHSEVPPKKRSGQRQRGTARGVGWPAAPTSATTSSDLLKKLLRDVLGTLDMDQQFEKFSRILDEECIRDKEALREVLNGPHAKLLKMSAVLMTKLSNLLAEEH
jgi:predicted GNAT family acetyltransferase